MMQVPVKCIFCGTKNEIMAREWQCPTCKTVYKPRKSLEDQYLQIADKLSDLDKLIVVTNNKDELEKLIRKRKPLADELISLYKKIYDKEKEAKTNEST